MCGFVFVCKRGGRVDEGRLGAALHLLRHRGPDASGVWSGSYANGAEPVAIGAGHARLSIIDLDARSNQPFLRGDTVLVHNGEIYNYRALRAELVARSEQFVTEGDTEVLSVLLGRDGLDGLKRANGQWAFCHLDRASGNVTAARDRYGKKPLFYYADEGTLCLGSTIAAVLAATGLKPELEPKAFEAYLAHGWLIPDAGAGTHIRGIRQVVAGGYLKLDLSNWTFATGRYADLADYSRDNEPAADLAALIGDAVELRLVSDRKVGLLLSGGVDSSLVLSVLKAKGLLDGVTCFTGDAGKSDDADYARRCIEQLGVRAHNIPLDYGSMDRFLRVCKHQEKPFPFIGNVLAMPQMYEAIAAYDVPVVLDGTGGDEIFAGYWDRYWPFALKEAKRNGDHAWLDASLAANSASERLAKIARKAFGPRQLQSDIASELARYGASEIGCAPSSDPLDAFDGGLSDALILDATRGRMQEWLWQNDRNAMLASIENRSPLLDYRLAPHIRTGYARKFVDKWNKHELRQVFEAYIPLSTQWRREKQGFRWVFARFFRQNAAAVADLIAGSPMLRQRLDVSSYLDDLKRDEELLFSGLTQRMLCIAGLEQTMGLSFNSRARQYEAAGEKRVIPAKAGIQAAEAKN